MVNQHNMEKIERMAILVDGDNAQAKLLKDILDEVAKYGKVTIRRIYGDWTTTNMNSWKTLLNDLSFTPMQKFSYTNGKNSTDGALIIDAMDILHAGLIDGFCIVSSDSDYTGLAKRIREEGVFVMGIGVNTTPAAFVNSCEVFTYIENIVQEPIIEKSIIESSEKAGTKKSKAKSKDESSTAKFPKVPVEKIDKAYFMSTPEDTGIYVSQLGLNLRKTDPSFDSRAYGFQTLSYLLKGIQDYEVYKNDQTSHLMVKRRDNK